MAPEVIRTAQTGGDAQDAAAEQVALALMGVGALDTARLAEAATWERGTGALMGRDAIAKACAKAIPAQRIRIDQIVTHGAAGSVSGRITRQTPTGTKTHLYCHVIRYTSPAATQIAQLVSFEHPGGA